jgi:hypothetical protein
MAINVLRGLRNRVAGPAASPDGYSDANGPAMPAADTPRGPQVACATCGRPLALTQTQCPGCGLRVLAGVPLRHGAILMVTGTVVGLIVGASLAVVLALAGRPGSTAADLPAASVAPGELPAGSGDPSLVSGPVPSEAATALRLAVTIEDRLAASASSLNKQAKAKSFNAVTAATTIRAIAADAAWGSDVVDRLSGWPAGAPLRAQLESFYQQVRQTARDALGVSIKDAAKYKQSAKRMVKLLASIASTRKAMEALAAANHIKIQADPKAP